MCCCSIVAPRCCDLSGNLYYTTATTCSIYHFTTTTNVYKLTNCFHQSSTCRWFFFFFQNIDWNVVAVMLCALLSCTVNASCLLPGSTWAEFIIIRPTQRCGPSERGRRATYRYKTLSLCTRIICCTRDREETEQLKSIF